MDSSGLVIVISGSLVALGSVIAIIKKDLLKCQTPCMTCTMRETQLTPNTQSAQAPGALTMRINQNIQDIESNTSKLVETKKNILINKPRLVKQASYP